ncbi:MAG: type IV prepilin leader peptidase PilD, leader peptidase (prepilin peptidase) / N-methyltransferase [Candidatus Peregrinibacteria bacterium GW2011_GWF2_33_10]|nr:MAG: type IV prepilin leader peptidase PilD, leader peptidase (prepilin peptidase) / N-methyltransferase [Candidatus Peregrinibacteria bacterium GW2011_GWF2_33_10]OGJ44323.1 MAG: hypothetical protein A2263_05540 [Candidatus Peregrinibacteria bacterium RIFOXYA2_FULL_33_21]OGJ46527.1 MAG: hypothetical protein A2272_01410 [Candidatus Peregrinibacteria bacterium RIFOXYA12_FULL_33_12]OGJ50553.1 MAG: hypothetical protein A2307_03195 [Candidatus Peregrinibacteria bacterium RIFOXYB2_FULL_33_20]
MIWQIIFLLVLGTFIGSFLSVLIPRLYHDIPGIIAGRSHCSKCQKKLSPSELIPIISYVILKGKCSKCKKEISLFYPLIELSTGILFAISLPLVKIFSITPFSLNSQNLLVTPDFWEFMIWIFILTMLVFIFFYDARYYSIDDRVMIPALILTAILIALLPTNKFLPDIKSALLGALIPFLFFLVQILISKGKWIGTGDLRIGLFIGLILGWPKIIIGLFLSYIIGSIFGIILALQKGSIKNIKIPFGPFLTLGTFITIFAGDVIWQWYLNLIYV